MSTFHLELAPDAGLLCRVIGLIAQRDLEIERIAAQPDRAGMLRLSLEVRDLDASSESIVAAKMARLVGVTALRMEAAAA
ncbi:hypothetical protein F9288_09285 [Sphingomonas sp. CL5.1]|uniref:hypothetical protein n=1 Tax=Sphingomonas sp. CL5.1 TaxID=2653203 RepID=UPI0015831F2A|nr:hypothetical protein [Sphingomonas sp. CL5.1]QKR99809.1 hypothetical protein F9288_09285 [Sphingomonas sp. CL5.1]